MFSPRRGNMHLVRPRPVLDEHGLDAWLAGWVGVCGTRLNPTDVSSPVLSRLCWVSDVFFLRDICVRRVLRVRGLRIGGEVVSFFRE